MTTAAPMATNTTAVSPTPPRGRTVVMAGGGTGGHVIPALAVARELAARGHKPVFIGTRSGFEARLVPAVGFPIEWIEIGALQRSGAARILKTLAQLPASVLRSARLLGLHRASAVFSMGGYAAGPVVLAAILRRIPVVVMEPNAKPGLTNRMLARFPARVLVSFPEAARYFPAGRVEITGLPVRAEFFDLPDKVSGGEFTVLITGGSRGARSLNRAASQAWPLLAASGARLRLIHQTGADAYPELARGFAASGLAGRMTAFLDDMPAAFAEADLVVCRSGAGAVAELAAAGKPSILVPFPFAADDHQLHNAEAMVRAGAARLVRDAELSGERLATEIVDLLGRPEEMARMSGAARRMGRAGAAARAAELLEQLGRRDG